ncbi:HNH endonuclease [Hyalangium gracile]|uniref:HNH endonuclease n=1 Tax=Hyalangium gracile TaxID=394092 RepID=UPI001CCD0B5F|nr:HNH endonuclease signature motif containing protein [Hyalangium gracile]
MRKLSRPKEAPATVFLECVEGVAELGLRERFLRVRPDIEAAAKAFEAAARAGALYTLEEEEDVAGVVTKAEMSDLYDGRMARRGSPGRATYDRLMLLARGICPLCGQRTVSTLDHHLPRSKFPSLAVTPDNLVPACLNCNQAKRDQRPRTAREQTFHPYFDDFGQEPWLHAELIEGTPPSVRFSVQPPESWPEERGARVRHHFKTYQLGKLYAVHAGVELVNLRHGLLWLQKKGGAKKVRAYLKDEAASRAAAEPNSWQTALYQALSTSEWFCGEGLRRIRAPGP